ncbi:MAG: YajQ family cyclic di-GMP-binding protein [Alphaproteobacteria bacterium]
MAESSFDIVANFNQQELVNALDQARREIANRYDFKGSKTTIEQQEDQLVITTENSMRLGAIWSMLLSKVAKRNLSTKIFDQQEHKPAADSMIRQEILLRKSLSQEVSKKILKRIKDKFKKVKVSIQGDALRVSDKNKDTLQEVMALVKSFEDIEYPLQFNNYR